MFAVDKQFIADHLRDDVRELALKLSSSHTCQDIPLVIRQIAGRQAIRYKLPDWYTNENILYPEHLPLEQCSSDLTARYKSSLLKGDSFADLTGGFGVDCSYISQNFRKAYYVERQENLCSLARHNFSVLDVQHIEVVYEDAENFLSKMPSVNCIYLDPARRDKKGNKAVCLSDCEPDVSVLKDQLLAKADTVLIKLSPMLDISLALKSLPETSEVHVVSVENECKELLFLLKKGFTSEPYIYSVNVSKKTKTQTIRFLRSEEQEISPDYTSSLDQYLYEPNVSILKAGAYKILTKYYPLRKLHPDSHLYTSNDFIPDFPGRIFRVESVFSLNKKNLNAHLKGISQAHITVRNFPVSVDDLRKKLKLREGGEVYLFATTLYGGERVIIKSFR